ncbi:MAG: septum site-determining protein MinC [Candidatus Chloroheliales bacterium]|nr:MAG: septum site-determining protein MinC [Chloroflexota bacterium]
MAATQSEAVIIKGVRGGLLVLLDDQIAWDDLLAELDQRVQANQSFFSGAKVTANLGGRPLDKDELSAFIEALGHHQMTLDMVVSTDDGTRYAATRLELKSRAPSFVGGAAGRLAGSLLRSKPDDEAKHEVAVASLLAEEISGEAMFVRRTMRSGQRLRHDSDICIVGDVNAGAEVVAGGDVVVWGSLRGMVHAGASGNDKAVICALVLAPTILRIAEVAGHGPAPEPHKRHIRILGLGGKPEAERAYPEIAHVVGGNIVVERWK